MTLYLKDSRAAVGYLIDWGSTLAGRAIAETDWQIAPDEPGGAAIDACASAAMRTRAIVSGGLPGRRYDVTVRVRFDDGSAAARTLSLEARG